MIGSSVVTTDTGRTGSALGVEPVEIVPAELSEANAFVALHHRYPPAGSRSPFQPALIDDGKVVGC